MAKYLTMKNKHTALNDIFDDTVQVKTQFSRRNGKLKMVRRKATTSEREIASKPMFPISKERK